MEKLNVEKVNTPSYMISHIEIIDYEGHYLYAYRLKYKRTYYVMTLGGEFFKSSEREGYFYRTYKSKIPKEASTKLIEVVDNELKILEEKESYDCR